MEAHLGHDFSRVRVHRRPGAEGGDFAGARAFTTGENIFLSGSRSLPGTEQQRLLAHELAHVVQQTRQQSGTWDSSIDPELEAAASVTAFEHGQAFTPRARAPIGVMREDPVNADPVNADPASPLSLPAEGVDMPWVGKGGASSSELGYLRDPAYFWNRFQAQYGDRLSPANRALIANGGSPVVDDVWIKYYPQHAAYQGEILEHHHVGQGPRAVPLPESLHDAYTVFHPQRRMVGTPSGGTRPLPPQPTRTQTEAEIQRHTKAGRIRGPGITPESPPAAPKIPASSVAAADAPHASAGAATQRPVTRATGEVAVARAPVVAEEGAVTGRTTSATATQSIRPAENVPAAPPKTESGLRTAGVADPVADLSAEVHAPPRVAPASGPAELGPVVSTLDKGMAFSRALLGLAEIAGTILSGIAAISDFEQHDYVGGGLNTAAATGVVAPTVGEVAAPLAIAWENTKNVAELAGWEGQCRVMAADFETGQISNYEFEQLARSCPEIMIGREEWQRVMRAWINDEWPGDY